MSERGVFALDRGWFDHPSFAAEPFTEREAWAWLISEAAFKDRSKRIGSLILKLDRGQVAASLRFMADKWCWKEPRVRRFLGRLKIDAMVTVATDAGISVVTICNYTKYQRVSLPKDAVSDAQNDAATTQQRRKVEYTESIETDSEANASGAEAPIDHRKRLFNEGLKKLGTMTGKGPDACRSFVGKCLKAASDDAIVVLGLIEDAERNQVVDPSAWIASRLKQSTGPPAGKPLTPFQAQQQATRDVTEKLKQSIARGSTSADRFLPGDHGERPGDLHGGAGASILALPVASRGGSG